MKRLIELGSLDDGRSFAVDLDVVLTSNLLFQANSGGGKSFALRRMIEQTAGKVPQIVIDPEGEFSTLRQKFDIILVGKDGDTPADVRSAQLLAHRLLELGVSAVVDLFEMSPTVRPLWTASFLQAMVDAPKNLWRELLVYVDEAHMFAPEPGHGAVDSEAHRRCRSSMIEMASRGRKRGYGLVAATQRLGKLSKDFAAELKNVMVGMTFIDIDRERAAGSLGIAKADKASFFRSVKTLAPGTFFAMGRALTLDPTLVRIGDVQTEHPKAGRRQSAPPPPTDRILHLLPQLADLPKEAEQKIATEKELRARIVELERQIAQAKPGPAVENRVEVPVVPAEWRKGVEDAFVALCSVEQETASVFSAFNELLPKLAQNAKRYVADAMDKLKATQGSLPPMPECRQVTPAPATRIAHHRIPRPSNLGVLAVHSDGSKLGQGERKILIAVAQHGETGVTREQLTVLAGYKRSTRDAYIQRLRVAGLIEEDCGAILATDEGIAALGADFEPLPTGASLLEHWLRRLPDGERVCLECVVDHYPDPANRDAVGELTGYKRSTRDAYLQRLMARRLILDAGPGKVKAARELFE